MQKKKFLKVSVKAQFLLDGHVGAESLTFLDETVRIAHFEDCALRAEGSGRVESIAIGERQRRLNQLASSIVVSFLFTFLLCMGYRKLTTIDEAN